MEEEWIHPGTITGDAATEGRYLRTEYINEYFWREVAKGIISFLLRRRVSKIEAEEHVYRFISPLLHQFWLQKYPIYA
jgi:hypothetical protein